MENYSDYVKNWRANMERSNKELKEENGKLLVENRKLRKELEELKKRNLKQVEEVIRFWNHWRTL